MKEKHRHKVQMSQTEVEGMMTGYWSTGKTISVSKKHDLVHLDNGVWKLIGNQKEIIGFVKPQNCITSRELQHKISNIIQKS